MGIITGCEVEFEGEVSSPALKRWASTLDILLNKGGSMKTSLVGFRRLSIFASALLLLVNLCTALPSQSVLADAAHPRSLCQENSPLCTEVMDSLAYDGQYTGHD